MGVRTPAVSAEQPACSLATRQPGRTFPRHADLVAEGDLTLAVVILTRGYWDRLAPGVLGVERSLHPAQLSVEKQPQSSLMLPPTPLTCW